MTFYRDLFDLKCGIFPVAAATAGLALVATGCGGEAGAAGPELSGDDKTICYHAARGEATSVLYATPAGDADRLVEIASAIVVGSSDEEDEVTMRSIEDWCGSHGYDLEIPVGRD